MYLWLKYVGVSQLSSVLYRIKNTYELISFVFRTNLPKELMAYEDYPYKQPDHSFITQPEVLKYINDFAKAFNLLLHIKVSVFQK